ncbi:hypothetical protein RclHR1_07320013 [Rhizophagus clarus]|uniref:Uncharacterized protein n=1 Tax=Rhizophagus clarus TaxID=94130 RepID=A0A2Z6SBW3_9GLOM|nr:hypothetical protein RclHR1_07320013 [Rhizophagus clarus]
MQSNPIVVELPAVTGLEENLAKNKLGQETIYSSTIASSGSSSSAQAPSGKMLYCMSAMVIIISLLVKVF